VALLGLKSRRHTIKRNAVRVDAIAATHTCSEKYRRNESPPDRLHARALLFADTTRKAYPMLRREEHTLAVTHPNATG
jgi:hypothetical protein